MLRHRCSRGWSAFGAIGTAAGLCLAMLGGCSSLRPKPEMHYVYVTAKETYLRDRVAAVSNRTATVENGEKLEVLDHTRKIYKVRTAKGAEGWIQESQVATDEVYDGFQALGRAHQGDAAVVSAVVRDEVNMHLRPGRTTETFYRLMEGDKLQLLARATLPKPVTAGSAPAKTVKPATVKGAKAGLAVGTENAVAPPIAMEDWWLARDAHGRTGWLLSRYVDVDAPDSITKYAEGQRIVGAYVLSTVHDDGAKPEDASNGDIPIYLTLMAPYTAGLPYDFDQVRVFTWNMKMHRYETAFRDKNIEGYLPVKMEMKTDPYGKSAIAQTPEPTFTYKVLAADAGPVVPDAATGLVTPGRTLEKTYRLEGNLVRRVGVPGSKDEAEAHPVAEVKKGKVGKKKR